MVLTGQLEMAHTAGLTFLSDSSVGKFCFLDDLLRARQPFHSLAFFVQILVSIWINIFLT